jgi:hypothetical protein
MVKVLSVSCLAMLTMTGCATSYKPKGSSDGYSHVQLARDRFSVTFEGNAHTSFDKARKYVRRRASELTLEHGYQAFVIERELDKSETDAVHLGVGYIGHVGTSSSVVKPHLTLDILCLNSPYKRDEAIDAAFFLEQNFPDEPLPTPTQPPTTEDDRSGT